MRKSQKRAKRFEKRQAKKHRGKPLGGPGKPDYTRGGKKGEVKRWKNPVHSGVINKAIKDGVKEIDSLSGFTKPAIKLAKKKKIRLITRGKDLT